MQTQTSAAKLSLSRKLAYGVGDLGANLVFNAVSFYLLYYLTDISLLAASLAGLVLTLVRLIDAFTDPLIGYLSDRLQSPWGRRRPLIFFGAFPVGIFFYLLFAGSPVQGQMPMFFYFLAIYAGFFIAYSVVNVPYSALTPDMTKDFNERTSLTGYRMAAAIVGTLIAAGATKALTGLFPTERGGFAIVAAIYGVVFIVMTQVVFWGARGFDRSLPRVEKEDLLKLYRSALANKPFVLIAVTYILHSFAVTVISSSLVYYLKYYIKQEDIISFVFLVLLLTAMACIPFWVWLSNKAGKKVAYLAGMAVHLVAMLILFFLRPEPIAWIYVLAAFAGAGLSTFFVLPWAMVPDTLEYHALKTGQRIEGIFYGIWNFGPKLGSAIAGFSIGTGLTLFHYVPNLAEQSPLTILGIRGIFALFPALIIAIALIVLSKYPITQKSYNEMLAEIAENQAAQANIAP